MADVDAVATAVATGGKAPDNHTAATPAQSTDAKAAAATDSWGTVDEAVRKVIEAKGWKAPGDAVKSYSDLEKYASKNVQDMTPEEREKFVKRLGRPEAPDGYDLNTGVSRPEWMPGRTKEWEKSFRDFMHKVQALPYKDQPKAILEWAEKSAIDGLTGQRQAAAKVLEENETALRKAWGLEYDANWAKTEKVAKMGGDEVIQWLNSGPGKLAVVRKWMLAVGQQMSDDTLATGPAVRESQNGDGKKLVFDPVKMGLRK